MTDILPAALAYASMGYHVFPTVPGGKAPVTKNGLNDATLDRALIESWWLAHPDAGLAVACGPSNLFVIDVDRPIPWEDFVKEFNLPVTLVVHTPNGFHLWYTGQGPSTVGKLAEKVDTRGKGGYVLAPPTPGYLVREYRRMAPAPLLDIGPEGPSHEPRLDLEALFSDGEIPEGRRQDTLFRYACRLRAKKLNRYESRVILSLMAELLCSPPLPQGEVEKIVESVWRRYGTQGG